jgi:hypothetical protein
MTLLDVPENVKAEDLGKNGIMKLNVYPTVTLTMHP